MGGNLIDYPDPITTRTCNLVTFKMHINSTLSQPKRKYCSFDVKFFLSKHTNGAFRVHENSADPHHENSADPHPRRNHYRVCITTQSTLRWRYIHRNTQRDVWAAASWDVGQSYYKKAGVCLSQRCLSVH